MGKIRLGRHININHGFMTAPWYANNIGCNIFQIFLGSPQRIISKARQEQELIKFADELEKYNLKMVVHGSYIINLCHPKKNKKFDASIRSLIQDLNATSIIGNRCLGVIIHMGKNVAENQISDGEAIDNYIIGIKTALKKSHSNTRIILETGASQGSEVASNIEGLAEIYWRLNEEERKRVFFCIDTCHIWATGYDISDKVGVKKFFDKFEDNIGIDKIICIHFNDSKNKLQSCVDRHADIGYGEIGTNGLKTFAQYAKKYNIPLIMETPLDAVNIKTNKDITFSDELEKVKLWIK